MIRKFYRITKELLLVLVFVLVGKIIIMNICNFTDQIQYDFNYIDKENDQSKQYGLYINKLEELFHENVQQYHSSYYNKYKPLLNIKNSFNKMDLTGDKFIHPSCKNKPYLLVLVHSSPSNIKRRLAIRYSWGKADAKIRSSLRMSTNGIVETSVNTDFPLIRYLFLIGKSKNAKFSKLLREEFKEYNDILKVDLEDNYRNLTLKTLLSLKWVNQYCPANFIFKTDDDCFVNTDNIIQYLQRNENTKNLYTGRVQWTMPAIRDKRSKFYVPESIYDKLLLPPYVSGGGYIFSGRLLPQLLKFNLKSKIIPNEDAHIGFLMDSIGVKPIDNIHMLPYIYCNDSIWKRSTCDFVSPYVIHNVQNYEQLWLNYHVHILLGIPGICKQSMKYRSKNNQPLYCPVDLNM